MSARGTVVAVAVTVALIAPLAASIESSAAAPTPFCGSAGFGPSETFHWTGGSTTDPHSWGDPANWDRAEVPGTRVTPDVGEDVRHQLVCIGTDTAGQPATVDVPGDGSVHVAALDLGQGSSLHIATGGKVFLGGAGSTDPSYVRPESTLQLEAATLGGYGVVHVQGLLRWTSVETAEGQKFAATQTTRECDLLGGPCTDGALATAGRTVIDAGGDMDVDGAAYGGVNLEDGRTIVNHGTVRLTNVGYVAADHGTAVLNAADGTLLLEGNGGIYEGRDKYGQPLPTLFENGALTTGAAGTGANVLGVDVVLGANPTVTVRDGLVAVQGTEAPIATVLQGESYGEGTCHVEANADPCGAVTTTASDRQAAVVTLPGHFDGSSVVGITERRAGAGVPARTVGRVVALSGSRLKSDRRHAVDLQLLYDATLVQGKDAGSLTVKRRRHDGSWVRVPACPGSHRTPRGSCVAAPPHSAGGHVAVGVHVRGYGRWIVV